MAIRDWGKPRVDEVRFRYEYAGITVADERIPWCAEHATIEASIRPGWLRSYHKGEFGLRRADGSVVNPAALEPDFPDTGRLAFLLRPPLRSEELRVCWRGKTRATLRLPGLSAGEFVSDLRLETAVLGRLAGNLVPCRAAVGPHLQGLLVCGVLTSPTSLVPLLDRGVTVEVTDTATGWTQVLTPPLARAQLQGRRAFLSAAPAGRPAAGGAWQVRWRVGGVCLAEETVRVLDPDAFRQSVHLVDAGYCSQGAGEHPAFRPHLPPRGSLRRVGPCFRLASRHSGAAGLCPLELRVFYKDSGRAPAVWRQEVLITDGPSPFMPLLLSVAEFEKVASFELLLEGRPAGTLPGCVPVVRFTSEGGFTELADLDWTPVTEDDLNERLQNLMEVPDPSAAV
jgi:hypothetical protein